MMIALLVEGDSDAATIPVFIRKIIKQASLTTRVIPSGDLLTVEKACAYITYLLKQHHDVSKVIVCFDADCRTDITQRAEEVEQALQARIKCPIYYIAVTHALEGWLLAAPGAITGYLGRRIDLPSEAALDCKPKKVMEGVFRKAGRKYIPKADAPKIAENIDEIGEIAKRNPSFEKFRQKVTDP